MWEQFWYEKSEKDIDDVNKSMKRLTKRQKITEVDSYDTFYYTSSNIGILSASATNATLHHYYNHSFEK